MFAPNHKTQKKDTKSVKSGKKSVSDGLRVVVVFLCVFIFTTLTTQDSQLSHNNAEVLL